MRKSHWLCKTCDVAIPRTTAACRACHAADISNSDMRAEDVPLLVTRLRQSGAKDYLRILDCGSNPLGAPGVVALAGVLDALPHLTCLRLAATCAADTGACAIADALRVQGHCPRLGELDLMGAAVKAEGGRACAALLQARALRHLGLGWNKIRGEAARELGAAAMAAAHLESFCGLPLGKLRRGELPPVPPLSERDKLRRPQVDPATELHLQGCGCGAPGAYAVAAMLPQLVGKLRQPLRAVVMPYQDLGDEGAEEMARAAAAECPQLSFIMLSRNDVGFEASRRIRGFIPHLDDFHLRINNRGG